MALKNLIQADDSPIHGAFYYALTTAIVICGGLFGTFFVELSQEHPRSKEVVDAVMGFSAWDGTWYREIVAEGYSVRSVRDARSNVAFFPAYPLLATVIAQTLHVPPEIALLLVSHAALLGLFIALHRYVRVRWPEDDGKLAQWVLIAFGLFPFTLFFRMTYSESLFLLFIVLAALGIERRWPLVVIALLAGAATGTRLVGVAMFVPTLLAIWDRSDSSKQFLLRSVYLLPLALWGILAYMGFLYIQFGDPWLFARVQAAWSEQHLSLQENIWSFLSLKVFTNVYDPGCPCYWGNAPPRGVWLFNMRFWNPIVFVAAVATVLYGWRASLLRRNELLIAAVLLGIPFLSHGARVCMTSEARYASAAFPI